MKFLNGISPASCLLALLIASCSFTPALVIPEHRNFAEGMHSHAIVPETSTTKSEMLACVSDQLSALATFEDVPQLKHLLESARAHNLDLQAAELRIQESQASRDKAWSELLPTLGLQVSELRADNRGQFNNLPPQIHDALSPYLKSTTSTTYSSRLGITGYEVDLWGRMRNLAHSADASLAAKIKYKELSLVEVNAEVMIAYYELLYANSLRNTLLKKISLASLINSKLAALRHYGRLSQIELKQSQLDASRYEINVRTVDQQIHTLYGRLFLLTGDDQLLRQHDMVFPQESGIADAAAIDQPSYVIDANAVLLRPDVQIAELNIIQANGRVGAARAAFFPMLTLDMTAGRDSNHFSDIFSLSGSGWSFSPTLLTTIFDFGKKNANLNVAKSQASSSLIEYRKTLDKAYQDLQAAIDNLELSRIGIKQSLNQQVLFSEVQSVIKSTRQAGLLSELERLRLELFLITFELDAIEARRALALSKVILYKALGGRYVGSCASTNSPQT